MPAFAELDLAPFPTARKAYIADVFRDAKDDFQAIWPDIETYLLHSEKICKLLLDGTQATSEQLRNRFAAAASQARHPELNGEPGEELETIILNCAKLCGEPVEKFFRAEDPTWDKMEFFLYSWLC